MDARDRSQLPTLRRWPAYFIAKPMPAEALIGRLSEWQERLSQESLFAVSAPR